MKTYKYFSVIVILALLVVALPVADVSGATINAGALNWSVQYLIDQSQTVLDKSQSSSPRDNRGLAISPNGQYLYAGYNNGLEVRKIDLTQADYTVATIARTTASRGKAIAVDDIGRVYLADATAIKILDANLSGVLYTITVTNCEGVAVRREGSTLVLYATDRSNKTLTRWELSESEGTITGATMSGLGGTTGQLTITGASSLRGVEVDASGRIWMADISANKVFRINSDGTGLTSVTVASPIDIGFDDTQAYVTQYTARTITVLSQSDMSLVNTLTPPLADLKLAPTGQSGGGALSGIVVTADGFYVANEAGQTENEKSTYGRTDSQSGSIGTDFYTDLTHDDNDPILKAVAPNQPPVVLNAAVDAFGNEGSLLTTSGSFTDPDSDAMAITVSGAGTVTDNGDGTWSWNYTPTDNGTGSVIVTADDGKGGTAMDTFEWTAYNVAPDVTITAPVDGALYTVNAIVNLSASYTDPGSADTHSYFIDWDDSTTNTGAASGGTVSGSHAYTVPGVYTIDVTVTDDDGDFDTKAVMVVVYDPSGGFVTGGGWILSPAGAYTADPSLEGKATFGFVSKYKKGASVPEGNTEFQFKAGDLNFKSTSYQWLVVNQAGTNAQYKGYGTINGAGNYGFMLWAGDGSPDTFRIQIWDAATEVVVYDNGMNQAIGGGSIVVHKAK